VRRCSASCRSPTSSASPPYAAWRSRARACTASELEASIAAIWRDVLKLPQVGAGDNFFDLGGHSLLAVQALARLRQSLQRELSITDIFRFPTVRSLAQHLGQPGDDGAAAQRGASRAAERRVALQRRTRPAPTAAR
jgi:acyl carrier protein